MRTGNHKRKLASGGGYEKGAWRHADAERKNHMDYNKREEMKELAGRLEKGREDYRSVPVPTDMEERIKKAAERAKKVRRFRASAAAVAATVLLVLLPNADANIAHAMGSIPVVGKLFQAVTFRDYQYESERFRANVEVPQIVMEDVEQEKGETKEDSGELAKTLERVNFDIEEVTDRLIAEFEASANLGESYGGLEIHHETVTDNERYFTLKLSIYQAAGSGTESYRFYTIDKRTGQQIRFGDLFAPDSGYNALLSENIREQMRAIMAADESKVYWVDYSEVPEWEWQGLKEDQNFYLDESDNLVFVFDEYEVAPGYMGASEFTVERAVFEDLLKK